MFQYTNSKLELQSYPDFEFRMGGEGVVKRKKSILISMTATFETHNL